jgi:pyruvate/2-oxoglutarate dehydrogenase complex dihydrolipoamide acyltransferase (E2) component
MKTTFIISALAATALSKPLLEKKWVVYTTEVDVVTATVTSGGSSGWSWGSWRHGSGSSSAAAATSAPAAVTTEAPAPTGPAYTPPASSSPAPAPAPATTSAAPAAASSAAAAPDSYSQAILDQHNNHRSNASAPALSWSTDMASIAAEIAASCVYAHNTAAGGGGYGQNIGAGAEPSAVPALITNEMYDNEIGFYPTPYGNNNPDMTNFEKWGHYSQIVWKSTTSVGCATQYCPNGLANTGSGVSPYFTVCNYSPPGNFGGQYSNVGAPTGGVPNVVV